MRLDLYLVHHQYFESRNKAAASVKEGSFTVNGRVILKPSYEIGEKDVVAALRNETVYVARSAHKLLRAFQVFSLDWCGKTAADFGASTGGFCQVLLEKGVRKIYAVDIGTAQLHSSLKSNDRIVNMEHTNARYLAAESFSENIEIITADLSFISLKMVLPAVYQTLTENGEAVLLVKPQFEAGPAHLSKTGVVADRKIHCKVLEEISILSKNIGFSVAGIAFSGLPGESGNREYLLYLKKSNENSVSIPSAAKAAVYWEEKNE
ncbi:MAG: TlyA family RNA methyltransferase [Clostridia bacterium]|nr:TlyA family RNA methyltransferase [Clostridia bacterium]